MSDSIPAAADSGDVPRRSWTTTLYRLHDATGGLLYVGITRHLERRLSAHRRRIWWPDVVRVETTVYDSQRAALKAEELAIRTEAPRHNKALNPTWKRPPPHWTRGICPTCGTERRVDVFGFMSNHNHASGWCPGTGRRPRTAV